MCSRTSIRTYIIDTCARIVIRTSELTYIIDTYIHVSIRNFIIMSFDDTYILVCTFVRYECQSLTPYILILFDDLINICTFNLNHNSMKSIQHNIFLGSFWCLLSTQCLPVLLFRAVFQHNIFCRSLSILFHISTLIRILWASWCFEQWSNEKKLSNQHLGALSFTTTTMIYHKICYQRQLNFV